MCICSWPPAHTCNCTALALLAGIHDLDAASQEFQEKQLSPTSGAPSDQHKAAEYVRLRELRTALQKLQGEGLTRKDARKDSAAGILLKASTRKELDGLEDKLTQWEQHLKVGQCDGGAWGTSCSHFMRISLAEPSKNHMH